MKLTPRLTAIAAQIPTGARVADIGTDHAYIPVYLIKNRICPRVIASDNSPGPLAAARRTIELFNAANLVELRRGDGLAVLQPADGVDTIIIAGMGGTTISGILGAGRHLLSPQVRLVLQPMTDSGQLRHWLVGNGFSLTAETLVEEEGTVYEIIVAACGAEARDYHPLALEHGPLLIEARHPLLKKLLAQKLAKVRTALDQISWAGSAKAEGRRRQLEARCRELEEVIGWL